MEEKIDLPLRVNLLVVLAVGQAFVRVFAVDSTASNRTGKKVLEVVQE